MMFWRIGSSLDPIQEMTAKLYRTDLGSYLETSENYLAVTKKMMFVRRMAPRAACMCWRDRKNIILFIRAPNTRTGTIIPGDERDALIEENFMVGKQFPKYKIHLTHAFGFSEQEYLISFETDEPKDFLALAEELRQTPASKLTLRGMPVYTCRQRHADGMPRCYSGEAILCDRSESFSSVARSKVSVFDISPSVLLPGIRSADMSKIWMTAVWKRSPRERESRSRLSNTI